jgi:pSer/pThr/pTyr-binding forkhead associated (FHA) protein
MAKLIVSIDGIILKEVQLSKERTTIGRRPYNDVVIDNLAVSGEHAVLQQGPEGMALEDLHSTNGTYINGKAIQRQLLNNADTIEIGKYRIKYLSEAAAGPFEKTMMVKSGAGAGLAAGAAAVAPPLPPAAPAPEPAPASGGAPKAIIKVLSGAAAGREVPLVKVVTTIGKPGVAVAAITRRSEGYLLAHVDGDQPPLLNGAPVQREPMALKDGDRLELAGTRMEFVQE